MVALSHPRPRRYQHPKVNLVISSLEHISLRCEIIYSPPWASVRTLKRGNVREYPSGTYMMPWCARVEIEFEMVLS